MDFGQILLGGSPEKVPAEKSLVISFQSFRYIYPPWRGTSHSIGNWSPTTLFWMSVKFLELAQIQYVSLSYNFRQQNRQIVIFPEDLANLRNPQTIRPHFPPKFPNLEHQYPFIHGNLLGQIKGLHDSEKTCFFFLKFWQIVCLKRGIGLIWGGIMSWSKSKLPQY